MYQKRILDNYAAKLDLVKVQAAYEKLKSYQSKKEQIQSMIEIKYQDGFLRDIFVNVLGFTLEPDADFNLVREHKKQTDAKKADGAVVNGQGEIIAIIELKDSKTKNLAEVENQAFNYKNNFPTCHAVITSNFTKLRLYIDFSNDFIEFDLFSLNFEQFKTFYLLLNKESVFANLPKMLKEQSLSAELEITGKFYNDYKTFRFKLFETILNNNFYEARFEDKKECLKLTSKLLDRLIFIFFAEDKGLIPVNSVNKIIEQYQNNLAWAERPLYEYYKIYFKAINEGNPKLNIAKYNGGLFANDARLDNLIIPDQILELSTKKLSEYDFDSQINVNILGHIFEQSLNDIEEILAGLANTDFDKNQTKRKKEGVYYTPEYITKYIVEQTVGAKAAELKAKCGLEQLPELESADFEPVKKSKTGLVFNAKAEKHLEFWNNYRALLLKIKIVDPACGSGAFLNQAFNWLHSEHEKILAELQKVTGYTVELFDTDTSVLENNLFGVDINEEAVEIARLSLWLRTARPGRLLTDLSKNIKCGNSLIDDPAVAGDKAFVWEREFEEIFADGGFDVVVGNPPYVRQELIKGKEYLVKNYQTGNGTADLYIYFYELGYKILKTDGILSFISSNTFTRTGYAEKMRLFITQNCKIINLLNFGDCQFFEGATTRTAILTFKKCLPQLNDTMQFFEIMERFIVADVYSLIYKYSNQITLQNVTAKEWAFGSVDNEKLLDKLYNTGIKFKKYVDDEVYYGIKTGFNYAFIIDEDTKNRLTAADARSHEIVKPLLVGRNIGKYTFDSENKYLIFTRRGINIEDYPAVKAHLFSYYEDLKPKAIGDERGRKPGKYAWYEIQDNIAYYQEFDKPKIIYANMAQTNRFVMDYAKSFTNDKTYIIAREDYYLLAILNSNLIYYIVQNKFPKLLGDTYEFRYNNHMEHLPIAEATEEQKSKIEPLAKMMLALNKDLNGKVAKFQKRLSDNLSVAKMTGKLAEFYNYDFKALVAELKKQKIVISLKDQDEWEDYFNSYKADILGIKAQIERTDKEIDALVYQLYGLTDEEIRIVEGS